MGFSSRFKRDETPAVLVQDTVLQEPEMPVDIEFSEQEVADNPPEDIILPPEPSESVNDLAQYIADSSVSKITVVDTAVKIFANGLPVKQIQLNEFPKAYVKGADAVFNYVENNLAVSGVVPPVSKKSCLTIEKIECLTLDELVSRKILSRTILDFLGKIIAAKKNILLAGSSNFAVLNSIIKSKLYDKNTVVFQNQPKIQDSDSLTAFNTAEIAASSIENVIKVALDLEPEYLIADLSEESQMARLTSLTHECCGKIYTIPAPNAQSALFKMLNMTMETEHCNEKIAKSKLLHSFNYILDSESLYLIAPAKTAIITLKEIPA